jgi:hypothetical protein
MFVIKENYKRIRVNLSNISEIVNKNILGEKNYSIYRINEILLQNDFQRYILAYITILRARTNYIAGELLDSLQGRFQNPLKNGLYCMWFKSQTKLVGVKQNLGDPLPLGGRFFRVFISETTKSG